MSSPDIQKYVCEYADCTNEETTWDDDMQVYVCAEHENSLTNFTGYCSKSCILGNGCDGSC